MMKGLPLVLLIALVAFCAGTFHADAVPAGDSPQFSNTLVEPGLSVGPLKLGESRDRAVAVFPKKSEDQEWDDLAAPHSTGSTRRTRSVGAMSMSA